MLFNSLLSNNGKEKYFWAYYFQENLNHPPSPLVNIFRKKSEGAQNVKENRSFVFTPQKTYRSARLWMRAQYRQIDNQ